MCSTLQPLTMEIQVIEIQPLSNGFSYQIHSEDRAIQENNTEQGSTA